MKPRAASLVLVLLAIGPACAGPRDQAPATEVELDVFSGRPNPRWTMSDEEAELWSRIASLPSAPAQPEPDHLGYRGFLLRRGATSVRIYKGRVWVHERNEIRTLSDAPGLEAALLDQSLSRGFGDLTR